MGAGGRGQKGKESFWLTRELAVPQENKGSAKTRARKDEPKYLLAQFFVDVVPVQSPGTASEHLSLCHLG